MAIINYTETTLSNGNKLVTWPDLTSSDIGQPYQLSGFKISSVHIYRTSIYEVKARLWGSNEVDPAARGFPITDEMESSPDLVSTDEFSASYEWIYPKASGPGPTGLVTISVLVNIVGSGMLSTVAYTGDYNDLLNTPVIFSGDYNDLTNVPNFSTVATTGDYNDLLNTPVIFSGDYNDLLNKPTLFSGSYNDLTDVPNFSTVATTGDYNDLVNRPTLFSGSWNSLTDRPAQLLSLAGLTNTANTMPYMTGSNNYATTPLTPFARTLLDDANAATARGTLGLGTAAVADIIGTVSQSGGVPTGAIIERGSNANGEYVRFADGTQIAQGIVGPVDVTNNVITGTSGGLYRGQLLDNTLPVAFVGIPVGFAADATSVNLWATFDSPSNPSTFNIALFATNSLTGRNAVWCLIGRWF